GLARARGDERGGDQRLELACAYGCGLSHRRLTRTGSDMRRSNSRLTPRCAIVVPLELRGTAMALLIASSSRGQEFAAFARDLDPALDVRVAPDLGRIDEIEHALVWQPPSGLLKTLPNLRLIVSIGAGVDALLADPDLPDVPMVRFVDADLTGRMIEYVS